MFWIKCCYSASEVEEESSNDFLKKSSSLITDGNSGDSVTIKRKKVNVNDFTFMKLIGEGSFGKVILAQKNETNDLRAIKVLTKSMVIQKKSAKYVIAERNALILAENHPFITKIYSCFQTPTHLFFEMEYVSGGDLLFHLNLLGRFNEKTVAFYAAEIIIALQFLHRKKIIHRDLKLENILLDSEGHCKLADFGLCKEIKSNDLKTSSICGTKANYAPEIINREDYGKSCDWWALGILIYRMSSGYQPFAAKEVDLLRSIMFDEIKYPIYFGPLTLSILRGLLKKKPAKRLGCSEDDSKIRRHRFFKKIDWNALELRQVQPPFIPSIEYITNTRKFETNFTPPKLIVDSMPSHELFHVKLIGFNYIKPEEIEEKK